MSMIYIDMEMAGTRSGSPLINGSGNKKLERSESRRTNQKILSRSVFL